MGIVVGWNAALWADDSAQSIGNWPQWRGPLGTGTAPDADPPTFWSETENVRWKVEIPGLGHSSPIIQGDNVFLTTAIPTGEELAEKYSGAPGAHDNLPISRRHQFAVICLDRKTGAKKWQTIVAEKLPHEGGHYTGSLASASPVADGKSIFAYFGTVGLFRLDLTGKVVWEKQLGIMNTKHGHGEASSPALSMGTIMVNFDHEGQSFVTAIRSTDGHEIWRVARDEVTSWSSPLIVNVDGKSQVIIAGTKRVRGYDLANGSVIWECGGLSANVVATPVAANGLVFVASSYDTRSMMAIRLKKATGDITNSEHVVWSRTHRTPYVPSPLHYKDTLYFLRHYQGILSQVTATTGDEPIGPTRIEGTRNVYASPVAAADRIYVTDMEGATTVIRHGIPRILARNQLDDRFAASMSIAGNEIFLRGHKQIYCIASQKTSMGKSIDRESQR